jgi:enoyl-CoA hydratase/carnithine racemase
MIKKIMWEEVRQKMRQALFFESYGQNLVRGTGDYKEAVKAFMEKRVPVFKGS